MADASDSKSDVGDYVWVQVPSPACMYRIARSLSEDSVLAFFMGRRKNCRTGALQSRNRFVIMESKCRWQEQKS